MINRKYSKNRPEPSQSESSTSSKNLHVSTSLPGPLTGYKRKRTQAVQVGDDSEFYKSGLYYLAEAPRSPFNNVKADRAIGKPPVASPVDTNVTDDDFDDEDDDDTTAYDEQHPHNVTSIADETTPLQERTATFNVTPQKKALRQSSSGCSSEFCIKKAKCSCSLKATSATKEAVVEQSLKQPISKAASLQHHSTGEIQPLGKTKSVATHSSNEDEQGKGGFVDAVRGVFGGHFSDMKKRGDIENVVAKFAGSLVNQVGLEKKPVEIPHQVVVEREQWDSKVDFLLSVVGFAVDLSAVWRFPAVCFSNGGGAFLLPYILMILFCGLPLMYMELCLGQYQRNGCITVWNNVCPMFKGLGFAICIITSIIAMYYNTIIAWSLYILLSSISTSVPWDSCDNWWNSNDSCVTFAQRKKLTQQVLDIIKNCTNATSPTVMPHETSTARIMGESLLLRSDMSPAFSSGSDSVAPVHDYSPSETVTGFDPESICKMAAMRGTTEFQFSNLISSAEEYFFNGVLELNKSNGFDDMGPIKWQIAVCLMCVFFVVYFALWKGVKSSGKVVWFTATFPYAVLLVLLCRVMTLPGSWTGVKYFITPNLDALYRLEVWQTAAGQVLFQLGPGFGVLLALSSYNKFNNNCLTDAIVTTTISAITSIMAGFVVFATLGYIAGMVNKPIEQLEAFGYGLTFVAYPEAISTLPGAPIWAVLFFAMLINLGLDTTFGGLESMITGLLDFLPVKLYKRREYFVLAVIFYIYFGALPTCTYGGILLAEFYDGYGVEMPLLFIAFLECVGVCYIYGIPHFSKDIAQMQGKEPGLYWKFCWCFVSPFIVLFSFIAACFRPKSTEYRNIVYPGWTAYLGWSLTFFSISCIPIYIIYLFLTTKGSFCQRIEAMIGPNAWILVTIRQRRNRKRGVPNVEDETVGRLTVDIDQPAPSTVEAIA